MNLKVNERLIIMNILPHEGDYVTFKVLLELKKELSFSEEEITTLGLKVENVDGRSVVVWDETQELEKEVPIGEKAKEIIVDAFKELDKKGKINASNYLIYERFLNA